MVSEKFLKNLRGKLVHVDFIDEQGQMDWVEGILSDHIWDNEEGDPDKEFIEIESDTDLDRIPVKDIRKVYLKEEKK